MGAAGGFVLLVAQHLISEEGVIMLSKDGIHAKYNELYQKFTDRSIDDFEIFIKSRVVEYCLNTFGETSDNVVEVVLSALNGYVYGITPNDASCIENNASHQKPIITEYISKDESTSISRTVGVVSLLSLAIMMGYRLYVKIRKH